MTRKELIKWLTGILARGLAWFFAVKLGLAAAEAHSAAQSAAEALAAVALAAISIQSSIKSRKTLLNQPPPKN